jgi:hypothetical protein
VGWQVRIYFIMKEKVYLDSSIPSYYFDERESLSNFIQVTKLWWSEMADSYEIFISDAVFSQVGRVSPLGVT